MSKLLTLTQAESLANAVLGKVKDKGYAVEANLGDLAALDEVAESNLASALATKINGKADAATTIQGYGITDAYTKTETDNKIAESAASVNKPGGSLTAQQVVAALLVAGNLGKIYNVTEDFTTTADFVEGAGKALPAGTNIQVIDADTTGSTPTYKFDVFAGAYGVATTSGNGLMSSTDKTKLDGIEAGAEVNTVTSVAGKTGDVTLAKGDVGLGNVTNDAQVKGLASGTTEDHVVTFGADGYTVKDSGKTIGKSVPADAVFTDTTYSAATTSADGLMSSTDKTKLDGIEVATTQEVEDMIAGLDSL